MDFGYTAASNHHHSASIIFIDPSVADSSALISAVQSSAIVRLLPQGMDGVDYISHMLRQYSQQGAAIAHIHIVAHGSPGTLRLGNSELSLGTLNRYAWDLQEWCTDSGSEMPSIVLYGCNVAVGDAGAEFLDKLHHLTGANIRASLTPVGHASLGGTWELAAWIGKMQPSLAFAEVVADAYPGILPDYTDGDAYYRYVEGNLPFTDISGTGTRIYKATDQDVGSNPQFDQNADGEYGLSLDFAFNYYGTEVSEITIGVNGGIIMGTTEGAVSPTGSALPKVEGFSGNTRYLLQGIFPLWTDLDLTATQGNVYYQIDGENSSPDQTLTIQWNDILHAENPTGSGATFQVVLHEGSSEINFIYQDVDFGDPDFSNGNQASVGLSGGTDSRTDGIQYSFDSAKLSAGQSIRFLSDPRVVNNAIEIDEGKALTLTSAHLSASDFDTSDSNVIYTVTSIQHGTFSGSGVSAISGGVQFSQDAINNNQVTFTHNDSENAPSFSFTVNDNYTDPEPEAIAANITFNPINDAPILNNVRTAASFNENTINTTAQLIDSDVSLTDSDSAEFSGGQLRVTYNTGGATSTEILGIQTAGSVSFTGSTVSHNGTTIGTLNTATNGQSGKSLVVTFNSSATASKIGEVIQNLTYQNTSDTPANSRTLAIVVTDGDGGTSDTVLVNVTVNAQNDAPTVTVPAAQTIDEDTTLAFTGATQITLGDVDSASEWIETTLTATNGTLTLTNATALEADNKIQVISGALINGATVTLRGSVANLNLALDGMTFMPNKDYNNHDSSTASVKVDVDDLGNNPSGALTDSKTVTITVDPVNDAPVNTVPGAQSATEDTNLVFNDSFTNRIRIADLDLNEGDGTAEVTLSVNHGTISLSQATNLDFSTGSGTANSTMTFQGSLADINAALNGLIYRGNQDYNGNDTLTILTDDLGNNGAGNHLTDADTVAITVSAVNDAPKNTVPGAQSVNEDTDLVFSSGGGNAIAITDLDVSDPTAHSAKVDISVTKGTLTLNGDLSTLGLSFEKGDGTADKQIIMTGTIANLNTALNGLVYRGDSNYQGADELKIITNDLNNIGSGIARSDTDTVAITVDAVNDAPVNHLPSNQTVNEDTELFFNSTNGNPITISDLDVDEGTGELQVSLSVTKGVLTLGDTTDVNTPQGASGRTVVVRGTLTNINTALGSLKYKGDANYNGSDTFTISTSDLGNNGIGETLVDEDTFGITVTARNDAPVNTVPATAQSVNEDTDLVFSGSTISIGDLDAGVDDIARVTLSATSGVLTLSSLTDLTFVNNDGTNDRTMTFEGTIDAVNTALNGLVYHGDENYNGTDKITITTNDKGNTGEGSTGTDTDYIDITINAVNDAPELSGMVVEQTFNEQAINADPAILQSDINFKDVDSPNFDGGWLKVSYSGGSLPEDNLSVRDQGTGSEQIGVSGTDITYGGTSIGVIGSDGSFGSTLEIALNAQATVAAVEALIENLTYQNTSDTPSEDRTIAISVNDGEDTSDPATMLIRVNSQNDLPVIGNNTLKLNEWVEGSPPVDISSAQLSASDVDSNDDELVFEVVTNGAGYFLVNGVQRTEFTQKQITDGLVKFQHNGGEVEPAYEVRIFDGINKVSVGFASIDYTEVNDAPTLSGVTELVTFSSTEANGSAAVIDSSVSFSDVDSSDLDGGYLQVAYTNGETATDQLSVKETGGIEVTSNLIFFDDGNMVSKIGEIDSSMTGENGLDLKINFTSTAATVPAVKALIQSLAYENTSDTPVGDRTIAITVNDGDSAAGTSKAVETILSITPENDAPTVTAPAIGAIDEDASFTFAGTNLITIADPDAGNNPVKLTLVATGGTMTLSGTSGLTFVENDGTDDTRSVFTGTLVSINNALNGMVFESNQNFNGDASVQITIDDQGNTGFGGSKQDTQSVAITVAAINDTPTITSSNSLTLDEDTDLIFTGNKSIRVTDVDSSGQKVQATLNVNKGRLTLNGDVTGLEFVSGSGVNSRTMTFKGTVADINAALDGMVYRGNANFNSSDTLTLEINDLGNTGEGGELTTRKEIDLTVNAVNDAPVNIMPGSQTVDEEATLILNRGMGNAIQVSDVDADESTGVAQVTVTAGNGVLTLAQTIGLSFLNGDGTTDSTMTFSGSLEALNAALNGMAYRGNKDFFGQDAITVTTSDLGHTGKPGTLIDSDKLTVTVKNLNDTPTISGIPPVSVVEGNTYSFTPTAQDIDGDRLTFSILNKPSWATFDPNTGTLSGAPVETNIGIINDIVIQVSDGTETISLNPFSIEVIDSRIRGGDTNDSLAGGLTNDIILGLAGDDTLRGGDGDDTMYGDSGNDQIFGENGNDTLYGSIGNDTIDGGNGSDVIYGEDGNDKLFGQSGRDTLYGGNDKDILKGGQDNDRLYGDTGNDKLSGNDGNDLLLGGNGNDRLSGGRGDDYIIGFKGNDKLIGGSDNDVLDGGKGKDKHKGGSGKDVFVMNTKGYAIIKDYKDGLDELAIARKNGKKFFNKLGIIEQGRHTLIELGDDTIGKLKGVDADLITKSDFTRV